MVTIKKSIKANLVGMQFQAPPFDIYARLQAGHQIALVREPSNAHDKNAVRAVMAGHTVAYVDRMNAPAISSLLQRGVTLSLTVNNIRTLSGGARSIPITVAVQHEINEDFLPNLPMGNAAGIYRIYAGRDRAAYIGQANHINKRLRQHWKELMTGTHSNRELQRRWLEEGRSTFDSEVVEQGPRGLSPLKLQLWLAEKETFYIARHQASGLSLNIKEAEVVYTKNAREELDQKIARDRKADDQRVRERKKEIKGRLRELQALLNPLWGQLTKHKKKGAETSETIKKHSGWRSIFNGGMTDERNQYLQTNLRSTQQEIAQLNDKIQPISQEIRTLNEEYRHLKTWKQKDRAAKRVLGRAGIF